MESWLHENRIVPHEFKLGENDCSQVLNYKETVY